MILRIYAISDIHGCYDTFLYALSCIVLSNDNKLVLLGDYIYGPDIYGILDKIIELQNTYGLDKIIALRGNHEEMVISGSWLITYIYHDDKYIEWMSDLPLFYKTENQIFLLFWN